MNGSTVKLMILLNCTDYVAETELRDTETYFHFITKTRLFKYTENITSKKNENFQIKKLIFFVFLLKTKIVGTR